MKRKPVLDPDNGFADHGGYMSAKVTKLEEQFKTIQAACIQKTNLFEGISIFVNGYTNPPAEELKRIMMEHSGIFHHYQRSHTKFVIASNLPDVKVRSNITKNIVKPAWIVDSLKENRLLDFSKYLLHTNKNRAQPEINFKPKEKELKCLDVKDPMTLSLEVLHAKMKKEDDIQVFTPDEMKTGTAADPNFLAEFLNNSRLHHIATLGSGFKYYINDLRKNHNGKFPIREELKVKLKASNFIPQSQEIVMHIDMDCFFVSVSLRRHPHLKGVPVAVTHSKGKNESKPDDYSSYSEIASCSYEARAKGLKNGMFVGAALKLCPELKTIAYDFEEYKKTAYTLYNTVAKYTLEIEAVSCDELYADLKGLLIECQIGVMDFVTLLREEIYDQTGCTCSVGIGVNRLQARMATKEAKPNGQFNLLSTDVEEFMKNQKIRDLPGVGPNTALQLDVLNIETCGQLQNLPLHLLQQTFGKKFGETLQTMSRGLNDKKLVFEQIRKSVSVEVNYGIRFNEDREVHFFLQQVSEELSKRMKDINKKGKLLTLKIMVRAKDASVETIKFMGHGHVEKVSKSATLLAPTDDAIVIHNNVLKLLVTFNVPPHELRGIGVQISKLDEERKDSKLLEMFRKVTEKQRAPDYQRVKWESLKKDAESISPTKDLKQSPVKKRGRPAKFSAPPKATSFINDMFSTKKNLQRNNSLRTVEMIDPEVLAELPPELVVEILREYQLPDENQNKDQAEKEAAFVNNEPSSIEEASMDIMFYKENWRSLTKSWIDEDNKNIETFKEKLQHDASQLVRLKDLNLLYVVMRFLHRIIDDSGDKRWEKAYNDVAIAVQTNMMEILKKRLSIPKEFFK